jgi:hypothetical protein
MVINQMIDGLTYATPGLVRQAGVAKREPDG